MSIQNQPASFKVPLDENFEAIIPLPDAQIFKELYDGKTPPIGDVIKAPPFAISQDLQAKLNAKPFRRFKIVMKDGRCFEIKLPGMISYYKNTFQFTFSPLPRDVYRTDEIERINDLGPSGIDFDELPSDTAEVTE